eukprot:2532551-Prymnesium_polylepis.1
MVASPRPALWLDCRDCDGRVSTQLHKWKLETKLAEWASDWGVAEVKRRRRAPISAMPSSSSRRSSGRASHRPHDGAHVPAAAARGAA